MYLFGKGVCFYLTRLSLTSPSIRNWTSSHRGESTLLTVRGRGRERGERTVFKFCLSPINGKNAPSLEIDRKWQCFLKWTAEWGFSLFFQALFFFLYSSVYHLSSHLSSSHTLSLRSPNAVLCLAVRHGMSEQHGRLPFVLCSSASASQVSRPCRGENWKN